MKQHYSDEKTGISYTLQGNYYLPNLTLPAEKEQSIGLWGKRHKRYLQNHKRVTYTNLLTSGRLNTYLANINQQAENLYFRLVNELAEKENVMKRLKVENAILWVQRMNSIRNRATEVVNSYLIYA